MRKWFFVFIAGFIGAMGFAQSRSQLIVSSDIDHFWEAYDRIKATPDSARQYAYLQDRYLDKASPGLQGLIQARGYTQKDFMDAIQRYPRFWNAIRNKTTNVRSLYPEIKRDIEKLRTLYPGLTTATIYFAMGAFRTNGTSIGDRIVIGSEMALADSTIITSELPERLHAFYRDYHPRKNIALLCVHEYIHTQQKPLVENLLSMCLYEGFAEFISCKATGKKSNSPAIAFGKANQEKVIRQFVADLFLMGNHYNWLWGENRNELQVRDLGYYIGYAIAERFYNLSTNKKKAVRELIELDYKNEKEVERIVDVTRLLPKPLVALFHDYEKQRPSLVATYPFTNGSKEVKPGINTITLTFSEPMDTVFRGFDYGPLGEAYIYRFVRIIGWSADRKSLTYEVELQPNRRYQFLVTSNFRNVNGIRLKPYLMDFETVKEPGR